MMNTNEEEQNIKFVLKNLINRNNNNRYQNSDISEESNNKILNNTSNNNFINQNSQTPLKNSNKIDYRPESLINYKQTESQRSKKFEISDISSIVSKSITNKSNISGSNIELKKYKNNDNISKLNEKSYISKDLSQDNIDKENEKEFKNIDEHRLDALMRLAKSPERDNKRKKTVKRILRRKYTVNPNSLKNDNTKYAAKSLYLFAKNSKFRLFAYKIVENQYFDYFIITAILINSLILGLELSLQLNIPGQFDFFDFAEWFFYTIFACECLLKIIAWGFIKGEKAYLKDSFTSLIF
jgi:hypothetical protein